MCTRLAARSGDKGLGIQIIKDDGARRREHLGDGAQRGKRRLAGEIIRDAQPAEEAAGLGVIRRAPERLGQILPAEIHRNEMVSSRKLPAHFPETLALMGLRAGMVYLEHVQPGQQIRPPQRKSIHPGPEDHILLHLLLPDGRLQDVFRIPGPAEDDGGGAIALHPASQGAGSIRTRRRPGRIKPLERR